MYQFPKSREEKKHQKQIKLSNMGVHAPKVSKGRSESPLVASAEAKPLRRIAIRRKKSDYEAASSAAAAGGSFSISRMK